jgi:hypothetical protein
VTKEIGDLGLTNEQEKMAWMSSVRSADFGFLEIERKRVPGEVLYEADRQEGLLFAGYDPHFDGDEPPGL